MTTHQLESFVNCDVPGFSSIDKSTDGVSWTTVAITTGYVRFTDYLTAIEAVVTDYTFDYSASADAIVITKTGGTTLYFRFTASQAELLGFSSTTTAAVATTLSGTLKPAGICPVYGVVFSDSTPARQSKLRQYSHNRSRGIVFGLGVFHKVSCTIDYSSLNRILAGPCSAGRVRVGPTSAGSAYTSTNVGGYLEGHILRVGAPTDMDTVEAVASVELGIHAQAYTAPDNFDSFFGSLERGYSVCYYARIEGIPYTFTQGILPGYVDSARDTSSTLIVPDTAALRWRIDRESGLAMSAPVQIGILDPDNDLSLFGKPTKQTEITEAISTAAQTTVVAESVTGWGASGAFYIGKERMRFTSVDAGAKTFTVVRGELNDKTTFDVGGPMAYTTLTDRPHVWTGRIVELWGFLVDAFGRAAAPVASGWDNDYCRQLATCEIAGPPGYDSGVWSIHCIPLVKRLSTELGAEASGETTERTDYWAGSFGNVTSSPLIVVHNDDSVSVKATWLPTGATYQAEMYVNKSPTTGDDVSINHVKSFGADSGYSIVSYYDLISAIISQSRKLKIDPEPGAAADSQLLIQDYQPYVTEFQEGEDPHIRTFRVFNLSGAWQGQMDKDVAITISQGQQQPKYWRLPVLFNLELLQNTDGSYEPASANERLISTGANGKNIDSIVLASGNDTANMVGDWPSTGYALIDDKELVSYSGRLVSAAEGLVALFHVVRGLEGTEPADVWAPGVKVEAVQALIGKYGVQMLTMLESSGTTLRGTYDTQGLSDGYGISTDHIAESSVLSAPGWSSTTLLANKTSFKKTYGSMLGGLRQAVCPIRVGQRLKLGLIRTAPIGAADITLRNADLRLTQPPEVQRVGVGPNIVEVDVLKSPGADKTPKYTFRLLADIAARGGVRGKVSIPGQSSAAFQTIAKSIGASMMLNTMGLVAYKFKVGPHKDWLPGQIVDIDIDHPGVWDWQADTTGLTAHGVILEANRRLTGESEIVVLVGGAGLPAALCPSVQVTARSGLVLTLAENTFPDTKSIFKTADPVLLYRPGISGSYTEQVASTVSGVTMTLNASPAWLTALPADLSSSGVYVTYPSDDNASITTLQDNFTHLDDGTIWL